MQKLIAALLLVSSAAFAQYPSNDYVVRYEAALAGAGTAVTIQQPAEAGARVAFNAVRIQCDVACTVTLERDGTAATATAQTPVAVSQGVSAAKAKAFVASDVGVGTVVDRYYLAAGERLVLDLQGVVMAKNGAGNNLTVRCSSITGNFRTTFKWREFTQ